MSALRKPTDPNGSHGTGSPFRETAGLRHCMRCDKWTSQAGGGKNPRTKLWNCAGCLNPLKVGP